MNISSIDNALPFCEDDMLRGLSVHLDMNTEYSKQLARIEFMKKSVLPL